MESFHVELEKDYLVFSAAHFITYNGNICERLHGHNWRVRAAVHGELDENRYVIDFIALRDILKSIVDELDHRVLLPRDHELIKVTESAQEVEARFETSRWVFPREDAIILPVVNTTAEEIARYIGDRLRRRLAGRTGFEATALSVGVDENCGQWAVYEWREDR